MKEELTNLMQPVIDEAVKQAAQEVKKTIREENKRKFELDNPRYMSPAEVADMYDVTIVTIYRWEDKGLLRGYHVASRKRYLRSEVLALAKEIRK